MTGPLLDAAAKKIKSTTLSEVRFVRYLEASRDEIHECCPIFGMNITKKADDKSKHALKSFYVC